MKILNLNKKVWITKDRKIDGRYNKGKIVGIDKTYPYLTFKNEADFFKSFEVSRYKVAYIDCFTGRSETEWVMPTELSTQDPTTT